MTNGGYLTCITLFRFFLTNRFGAVVAEVYRRPHPKFPSIFMIKAVINHIAQTALLFVFGFFVAAGAQAAILTVTKTADADDGSCDADCSLREAVGAAASRDLIRFSESLGGATIQLSSTLRITKGLIIDGTNGRPVTIRGNDTFRIIEIESPRTAIGVGFESIIITGGNSSDGDGGGIYFNGNGGSFLVLLNTTVTGNKARSGGGVWINRVLLFDMFASTVAGNTSTGGGGAGIDSNYTEIFMRHSTVSENTALSPTAPTAGGIYSREGTLRIFSSTVADNRSLSDNARSVGGISTSGSRPGSLTNMILARNSGTSPDMYGDLNGARYNIVSSYEGFLFNAPDSHNLVGSLSKPLDPRISNLGHHGGSTPTHALLAGSPAVDSGINTANSSPTDQRGFERVIAGTIDRGSVESDAAEIRPIFNMVGLATTRNYQGTTVGVGRAIVTLTKNDGEKIYAFTNPFGYFRFKGIPLYETVMIEIAHKRERFAPLNYIVRSSGIELQAQTNLGAPNQTELIPELQLTDQ